MIYTEMTKKAMRVAYEAHQGQDDKGGAPYIFHPLHLAEQMKDELSVTAALLHDVLEDTDVTIKKLRKHGFSDEVIEIVKLLTHEKEVTYFEYIENLKLNPVALMIKIADLKHNSDTTRYHEQYEKLPKKLEKYSKALEMLQDQD
jgi:(p)ppGpp synthase/HD superfamily hydrolase